MTKKLRFKIFTRDNFTCKYCGGTPPECTLEVDHIISRKDGGSDDEGNLTTSCFNCNRGKSKKSLNPEVVNKISFKKKIKEIEVKKEQIELYFEFLKKKENLDDDIVQPFADRWLECSGNEYSLSTHGRKQMKPLIKKFSTEHIFKAIGITWENSKVDNEHKFRYMCGILKALRLEEENPEKAETERSIRIALNKFYEHWNKNKSRYLNYKVKLAVRNVLENDPARIELVLRLVDETMSTYRQTSYTSYSELFNHLLDENFNQII